jgi:hypothetical protein
VTGKDRPPGGDSQGPDTRLAGDESVAMVTDGDDDDGEVLDATGLPDCGWQ